MVIRWRCNVAIWEYNYRLKRKTWLLTTQEYAPVRAYLDNVIESIKAYREEHSVGLKEASKKNPAGNAGLKYYHDLTGDNLNNYYELYYIRGSNFGRLCPSCDKPFRSPRAKFCAECGFALPEGEVAGPLTDG